MSYCIGRDIVDAGGLAQHDLHIADFPAVARTAAPYFGFHIQTIAPSYRLMQNLYVVCFDRHIGHIVRPSCLCAR